MHNIQNILCILVQRTQIFYFFVHVSGSEAKDIIFG